MFLNSIVQTVKVLWALRLIQIRSDWDGQKEAINNECVWAYLPAQDWGRGGPRHTPPEHIQSRRQMWSSSGSRTSAWWWSSPSPVTWRSQHAPLNKLLQWTQVFLLGEQIHEWAGGKKRIKSLDRRIRKGLKGLPPLVVLCKAVGSLFFIWKTSIFFQKCSFPKSFSLDLPFVFCVI